MPAGEKWIDGPRTRDPRNEEGGKDSGEGRSPLESHPRPCRSAPGPPPLGLALAVGSTGMVTCRRSLIMCGLEFVSAGIIATAAGSFPAALHIRFYVARSFCQTDRNNSIQVCQFQVPVTGCDRSIDQGHCFPLDISCNNSNEREGSVYRMQVSSLDSITCCQINCSSV